MSIAQPSQYQIDNKKADDVIYVKKQPLIYRIYRKLFLDLPKVKVSKVDENNNKYFNTYYQEDCILIYDYEFKCVKTYNNEILAWLGCSGGSHIIKGFKLKTLHVGLYDTTLVFPNNLSITIPTGVLEQAINSNKYSLKQLDTSRMVAEITKYQQYDGTKFKEIVEKFDIKEWTPAYCSVCGKPINFIFEKDIVKIDNQCECGELEFGYSQLTYDELSVWYYNQTNSIVRARFEKFWFKR